MRRWPAHIHRMVRVPSRARHVDRRNPAPHRVGQDAVDAGLQERGPVTLVPGVVEPGTAARLGETGRGATAGPASSRAPWSTAGIEGGRAPPAVRRSGWRRAAVRVAAALRTPACRARRRPGRRAPSGPVPASRAAAGRRRPSRVSSATRFHRWQTSVWPMRWMRPKRCSRRLGVPGQVVVDHQVGALQTAAAGSPEGVSCRSFRRWWDCGRPKLLRRAGDVEGGEVDVADRQTRAGTTSCSPAFVLQQSGRVSRPAGRPAPLSSDGDRFGIRTSRSPLPIAISGARRVEERAVGGPGARAGAGNHGHRPHTATRGAPHRRGPPSGSRLRNWVFSRRRTGRLLEQEVAGRRSSRRRRRGSSSRRSTRAPSPGCGTGRSSR